MRKGSQLEWGGGWVGGDGSVRLADAPANHGRKWPHKLVQSVVDQRELGSRLAAVEIPLGMAEWVRVHIQLASISIRTYRYHIWVGLALFVKTEALQKTIKAPRQR